MSARLYKITIPVILAFLVGVLMIAGYYLVDPTETGAFDNFTNTTRIVLVAAGEFAIAIGTLSLLRLHARKVIRHNEGWIYSIALIVSMLAMMATGIPLGSSHPWFMTLYNNTYVPLSSTMFSLLAFFIASAAYRAFRARNLEATIMLTIGCLMMLARVSIGEMIWPGFPALGDWFMNVPDTAGMRAIRLCVSIGFIATALRVLLGYDRTYLGVKRAEE